MIDIATIRDFLDETHPRLGERAARFADHELRPLPQAGDDRTARRQAREILALMGEGGWSAYAVPASYGGAVPGIDLRACCLIREALAAASPLADAVFALQCLGSMPVALAGSDELKNHWLQRVATGEAMAAFAMTEPGAGSDVAAMATRAVRDGDDYVLDGRKHLISNAGIADFYTVFAMTEPGAGTRGLTAFVVPAGTEGLRLVSAQVMSAPHPLGEIAFEGTRVPVDWRLGQEGEGFKLGMRTLDRLRATVAAAACGMAARARSRSRVFTPILNPSPSSPSRWFKDRRTASKATLPSGWGALITCGETRCTPWASAGTTKALNPRAPAPGSVTAKTV